MFVALAFACFFSVVQSELEIPMFGVCNNNERCQGTFVCKHHICLPSEDPMPVILEYSNDVPSSNPNQQTHFVPNQSSASNVNMPKMNIQVPQQPQAEAIAKAQAQALAEAQMIWQRIMSSTTKAPQTVTMIATTLKPKIKPSAPTNNVRTQPRISQISIQVPHSVSRVVISCKPNCIGNANCVRGSCQCSQPGIMYTPLYGCNFVSSRPMMAVPVPTVQRVPQAKPFEACEAVTECTGGSVCIRGRCLCPPELASQGEVCVTRVELGLPAY